MRRSPRLVAGLAALGAAAALAGGAARAQNAAPPPPVKDAPLIAPFGAEIVVSEVLLDVLVTDRKGNVILGLQPSDFEVTEDGKPVEVTSAAFYSHRVPVDPAALRAASSEPGRSAPEPALGDQAPADRYFIFFFDDQRFHGADAPTLLHRQVAAGRDVREFLAASRTPSDWIAVVAYDHRLKLVSDFTRDLASLDRAVEIATLGRPDRGNWPSRRADDAATPSLGRNLPSGDDLRDQTGTVYEAMTLVAEAASKIVGRKNLLLFTTGFGKMNRFRQYEPDPKYYDPMSESLNDANVAVYTFDLTDPGTSHPFANAMNQVSSDTGGRYFSDLVNYGRPLEEVQKQTSGYYLVSYRASHPLGLRGFQPVDVKVRNPELRVVARRGYRFGDGE